MEESGSWSRVASSLTTQSLLALSAGLLAGVAGRALAPEFAATAARLLAPFGDLWLSALQMIVLPLVVLTAVNAVTERHEQRLGTIGFRALFLFVVYLLAAALFTLVAGGALLNLYSPDPRIVSELLSSTSIPANLRDAGAGGSLSFGEWLGSLLPANLVRSAAAGEVLALLLFSLAFGLALRHLPPAQAAPAVSLFEALAAAMLLLVRWLMVVSPVAFFILLFGMAQRMGGEIGGVIGAHLLFSCGLMLGATLLLYPVTSVVGRVRLREFVRAVAPAQLVAISTRSSLASLPALLEGARAHLRMQPETAALVLPLSTALFKLNRTVSSTAKLMFVAHILGIPLSVSTVTAFVFTVILMSFTSVGVPGGGSAFRTLPAYVAAGIPVEAIIILEAVDAVADIFKTLLNVTADMSVAVLVAPKTLPEAMAPAAAAGQGL